MLKTPVLFIIFNRPDTVNKVFGAIRTARPKELYIAADGPRPEKGEEEILNCKKTREIVNNIDWDCKVKTLFRNNNLGCKNAVSGAISWFFENVKEGIIIEDDCLPTQSFFQFCELMLEKYRDNDKIGFISGTNYLFGKYDKLNSYFFSNHYFIWGWATYRRVWKNFNVDIKNFNPMLFYKHYHNSAFCNYMIQTMEAAISGRINTWDIQLAYYLMFNSHIGIIPFRNQITNLGIEGTHTEDNNYFQNMPISLIDTKNIKHPSDIKVRKDIDRLIIKNINKGLNLKEATYLQKASFKIKKYLFFQKF